MSMICVFNCLGRRSCHRRRSKSRRVAESEEFVTAIVTVMYLSVLYHVDNHIIFMRIVLRSRAMCT